MKIKSEKFEKSSLIREAVENGFGDLRVVIGNVEIKTFKFVLCVCNETLGKLLRDPLFEEPLMLSEDCSVRSFYLLERYYEGLEIELDESNSVELLLLCVYYNEEMLLIEVMKYIIAHLNEEMMIKLLKVREILVNEKLKELREKFDNYIKNKNDKLMKMNYLSKMEIENVNYLFSFGILFNGNEIDLLKLLLDNYVLKMRCEDEKEEMIKLLIRCKFRKETYDELNEEYKIILTELRILNDDDNENEKYSIRYCPLPKIENDILYYLLIKNYPSEDIQEVSFDKSDILLLSKEEISNDIDVLLKSNEIKVIMLVLKLCDLLNIRIESEQYFEIFDRLKDRYGIKILFCLLKKKNILDKNKKKVLMDYFHEFRLNDNEYKTMNSIIEDIETKRRIIYHELKNIYYSKNKAEYKIGEKVLISPKITNITDVEEVTIKPNLPSGLSIDKKTGVISGICNEECETIFTVIAKNIWNEVSATIELGIVEKVHFDEKMSSKYIQLDIHKRRIANYKCAYCYGYLNVKIKDGIYHFIFRINSSFFQIGAKKLNSKMNYEFYWCNNHKICAKEKDNIRCISFRQIEVVNNEYEVIFDMIKKTFSMKDKDGRIHTLISDLEREIYPFVKIVDCGSCELLKSWIE